MEFGILGPLVVWRDGREVPIGAAKQRALLTLLLLGRGELVPTETLLEGLWGERPPATGIKAVQVYVSQLRKLLGEGLLETRPGGYLIRLEPEALDAGRFEVLLTRARALLADGDAREAGDVSREALGLWRGPPLAEFRYEGFARDEIGRLEGLRLVALEQRLGADLALGHEAEAVPELEALVREHPLRERLRELLVLALYRAGRQADALAAYQDARAALVEGLGLDPGEPLQRLETAILRHDPALDLPRPARAPPRAALTPPTTPSGPPSGARGQPAAWAGRRRLAVRVMCGATVAVLLATVVLLTQGTPRSAGSGVSADSVGIFRPDDGRLTGQIPVGASPDGIAAGFGSVWVANVDAHTVSRVNPVKGVTVQTIQVGNGPDGIAVGGGFVWVANGLDGTVTKISPQTNGVVDTITVGNGPAGVVADTRFVWVANSSDGTVTQIDERTDKPRATIPVGQSADGIAIGDGSVWVTSESTGNVTRIDARSGGVLGTVETGSGADALAVGPQAVWVANGLDGTVTRVDPASNTVRAAIPVGDGPSGIALTGNAVWVSNELAGTLSRINPERNTVVQTVATGNRPAGIAVSSGQMFVAVGTSGAGHRGGTLTVVAPARDLTNVDPALAYDPSEGQVVAVTNDGLMGFRRVGGSAGTELVPDLAVSIPAPTDDGRSYSFQLRPGIRYSTGTLVEPQDFRRAIERSLTLASPYGAYYRAIVGARNCLAAPGKPCDLSEGIVTDAATNTVTFHLTAPDPDFLYVLALSAADAVPSGTPLHPHGFVPATGPYEIASFDPKQAIRLVRNPLFHEWSPAAQPSGFPDVITERFGGSPDAHVAAVVHGSADLALYAIRASPPALESVRTQYPSQLEQNPLAGTDFLVLNTRVAPFNDVRVRQALNFAIDRERLTDLTEGPRVSQVTCQVLPPDFDGYRRYCPYTADPSKSGAWSAPNLARARQLVRASGTTGQAVTVWIPDWIHFDADAGRYVVSLLDSLGYRASFRFAPDPYPIEDKLRLQLGFEGWIPDFAAPGGYFDLTLTCGSYNPVNADNENTAEFCDPTIDREITRAESLEESDPQAASRLWAEVDRDITNQAPWVTFASPDVIEVTSTRVGDYQYNPQWGTLLDQLWVR